MTYDEMKKEFREKNTSDYDRISVQNNTVSFRMASKETSADYQYIGFQTSKNDDGKIADVWYIYQTNQPTDGIPVYLAFNDHKTGSEPHADADEHSEMNHLHLRYGNDSVDALLDEENWSPTYFPVDASADEIASFFTNLPHHHEEEIDEHVWTSPANAIKIVEKISSLLCDMDVKNADTYKANTENYTAQLMALDSAFQDVVASAKRDTILFGDRFPFRYFAEDYNLNYYAAFTGCSTDSEASAATVAFLIDKVAEEQIPVVFTIEMSNGKIADSICQATGAKKLTLYSCHNITKDQMRDDTTYLSMMTENVESLRTALN